MFSIYNKSRFENFTGLLNQSFNARTKDGLIEILYEFLPRIFSSDILILMPGLLENGGIDLKKPKSMEISPELSETIEKIKEYYESSDDFPVLIDDWFVNVVELNSEVVFVFVVNNKALEKVNLSEQQKNDILCVVAGLITRIDELEDETQKNIKIEKEKLRSQILSSVSHDLKTPLAAIIGSLNILTSMDGKLSDDQKKELVETSVMEAHRLNNFITNILNMARIESGVVKAKMDWQNVGDLVKHIKRTFKMKFPERVLVTSDIPDYASVYIDSALFEQALMSILENAVKYSAPETEIELSVEKNSSLDFKIKDRGNGVPDDMLDKIFDKYTRYQMSDRKIAGTGLGLAISRGLAELQDIYVKAENRKEGGMIFSLSCPQWKI